MMVPQTEEENKEKNPEQQTQENKRSCAEETITCPTSEKHCTSTVAPSKSAYTPYTNSKTQEA